MKAGKRPRSKRKQKSLGLVANGSAGAWRVDLDETLSGARQLFAQIQGPSCYLYFEVAEPNAIVELARFLSKDIHQGNGARSRKRELKFAHRGGHTVEVLWDHESADRCFILLRGENEFCVRVTLLRDDLQALTTALEQVSEALREEGLVTKS